MTAERFLPDTCAWIDFFNARQTPLADRLEGLLPAGGIFTCGVVKYELVQGIKTAADEKSLLSALQAVSYLEMDESLWIGAGRLAGSLRGKGITIPFSDIIIAAIAMENGLTILTADRHFEQVPGLKVQAA